MSGKLNKKVRKRIISAVLVLAMVLSLCPAVLLSSFAEADKLVKTTETTETTQTTELSKSSKSVSGDFEYSVNDTNKTAEITRYEGSATEVTIPDKIGEYTVVSIGVRAFSHRTGLTSIDIPDSVTSIGYYAFDGCTGLTGISIPSSVTSIGDGAFYGCTGLTSIEIPNSVVSIGDNAFYGCTGLTSINIPNSVTSIGNRIFPKNDRFLDTSVALKSITVDESNTKYSSLDGVLYNKDKTTLIYYPAGKTDKSFTIPNSVTSIGEDAFDGCTGLTSVTIPNSVENIGEYAFYDCAGLTSITIPNSVKSIGMGSFWKCNGLTSVTIPDSVTIMKAAITFCENLTSITVNENNPNYSSLDGVLYNKDKTELIYYPTGRKGAFTIPNSVENLGVYAFSDCTGLTSVTIPNSVTRLDTDAFSGSGLTSVTIPNSVTYIGNMAFEGCKELTTLTIPSSVTICFAAFWNCPELRTVYIKGSEMPTFSGSVISEYVNFVMLQSDKTTGIVITGDGVPEGAKLTVTANDTASVENTKIALGNTKINSEIFDVFDINLVDSANAVIQPNGKVEVTIPLSEKYDGKAVSVYYINGDIATKLESEIKGGNIVFLTDHFSTYAVVAEDTDAPKAPAPENTATNNPTGTTPNSAKTGDSPVYFAALCLTLACTAALPILVRGKRKKSAQ